MLRLFAAALALIGLAACVPSTSSSNFPENYMAGNCFVGDYVFDLDVDLPREYGSILALTQHSRDHNGLRTVCRLDVEQGGPADTYPIYSGEVDNGRDGICVSARTSRAGHVISCASSAEVRRAMNAHPSSSSNTITLNQWGAYSGS